MPEDPAAQEAPEEGKTGDRHDSDIFVPPAPGPDPIIQALKKNPQNAGLDVAAGEFSKALELLRK